VEEENTYESFIKEASDAYFSNRSYIYKEQLNPN